MFEFGYIGLVLLCLHAMGSDCTDLGRDYYKHEILQPKLQVPFDDIGVCFDHVGLALNTLKYELDTHSHDVFVGCVRTSVLPGSDYPTHLKEFYPQK